MAINASGQVTGYSDLKQVEVSCYPGSKNKCLEQPYHAFLWSNGKMADLGTLGGIFSQGEAINGSGEVVGWATVKGETANATLWNGKTITALTGLEPFSSYGINDSGQIVGPCGPGVPSHTPR